MARRGRAVVDIIRWLQALLLIIQQRRRARLQASVWGYTTPNGIRWQWAAERRRAGETGFMSWTAAVSAAEQAGYWIVEQHDG